MIIVQSDFIPIRGKGHYRVTVDGGDFGGFPRGIGRGSVDLACWLPNFPKENTEKPLMGKIRNEKRGGGRENLYKIAVERFWMFACQTVSPAIYYKCYGLICDILLTK